MNIAFSPLDMIVFVCDNNEIKKKKEEEEEKAARVEI